MDGRSPDLSPRNPNHPHISYEAVGPISHLLSFRVTALVGHSLRGISALHFEKLGVYIQGRGFLDAESPEKDQGPLQRSFGTRTRFNCVKARYCYFSARWANGLLDLPSNFVGTDWLNTHRKASNELLVWSGRVSAPLWTLGTSIISRAASFSLVFYCRW